jgi:hypothetical protein
MDDKEARQIQQRVEAATSPQTVERLELFKKIAPFLSPKKPDKS